MKIKEYESLQKFLESQGFEKLEGMSDSNRIYFKKVVSKRDGINISMHANVSFRIKFVPVETKKRRKKK